MFIISEFNLLSEYVNVYKLVNLSGDIITRITFSNKYKLPEDGVYSINSYGPIYAKIRRELESVKYVNNSTGFNYMFRDDEIYITKIDLRHLLAGESDICEITRYNTNTSENDEIPPELIYLPNLEKLIIEEEALTSVVWGLTKLTKLTLWKVDLGYDKCGINKLTNLKKLRIIDCQEVSDKIFDLVNLIKLEILDDTILDTLIGISKLRALEYLSLIDCDISELPSEIGNLTRLRYLDISGNYHLTNIPTHIGYLTNIETLLLRDNSISTLSSEIGLLKKMTKFNYYGNQITGTIPKEIRQLPMYNTPAADMLLEAW